MAPHLALAEIGCDYELALVELDDTGSAPAAYLRLNPWGLVPTLEHDGFVLTESAAIMLHLADSFPEAGLAPPVGTRERAECYRRLVYLTNTIQPAFLRFFYPERYADEAAAWPAVKRRAEAVLGEHFDRLDGDVSSRDRPTVDDLFLFMLIRWGRNLAHPAWDRPALRSCFRAILERPATQRVFAEQQLELPAL